MNEYLTFDVAGDRLALPILRVREIVGMQPVAPVPGTAAFVRGVFNRAGAITPLIDVRSRFGYGDSDVTKESCIVLVDAQHDDGELTLGLLVDAVRDVATFAADDVAPPPDFGTRVRLDYLRGLGRATDDRFVLILDADRFLSAEELFDIRRIRENQNQ